MSPADLASRLGISPGESTAFLCLLAAQGKVSVRLVELSEEAPGPPVPAPSPNRSRRERFKRAAPIPASVPVGNR